MAHKIMTNDKVLIYGVLSVGENLHDTTYLEYEIPKAIEDKLSDMIEKELEDFYSKCQCDACNKKKS